MHLRLIFHFTEFVGICFFFRVTQLMMRSPETGCLDIKNLEKKGFLTVLQIYEI